MISQTELYKILDYDPVTGLFTWKVRSSRNVFIGDIAGTLDINGYIRIKINKKRYLAHRLAYIYVYGDIPDGFDIDHKSCIRNENWIKNLRCVTRAVNNQNRRCAQLNSSSGYLGVSWDKNAGKWQARIQINGKPTYLGIFLLPELAYEAYLTAKRQYHEGCTI